jgi:hypothetical protein
MEVTHMKASALFPIAVVMLANIPLLAQQTDADSSAAESAKTTYSSAPAGFGDDSATRSWEMAAVTGELQGKLDSKSARVGDQVVLKTTAKVQTPDGTVIPRGSHLVGHITEVEAHSNDRAIAQIGIAFDHVELKNGGSVQVHTLIRTVRPSLKVSSMSDSDMLGPSMNGRIGGDVGGRNSSGLGGGGMVGANPNSPVYPGAVGDGSIGSAADGTVNRAGDPTAAGTGMGAGPNLAPNLGAGANTQNNAPVQVAGHGDAPIQGGAHAAAVARTVPHATGLPGIMLAGVSSSSGLLIDADRRNIEIENGTLFEMGVVADR